MSEAFEAAKLEVKEEHGYAFLACVYDLLPHFETPLLAVDAAFGDSEFFGLSENDLRAVVNQAKKLDSKFPVLEIQTDV